MASAGKTGEDIDGKVQADHFDQGGSAKLVNNYDLYCEGDVEPHLGKKIHSLIYKDRTLIVYLDSDLNVEWAYTDEHGAVSGDAGQILNRATELQALPASHLTVEQKESFRMLVGEAVARILTKDGDLVGAQDALDKAVRFLQARNTEITRWWYLRSALGSAFGLILTAGLLWHCRDWFRSVFSSDALDVAMGAGAGAAGALLSILVNSRTIGNEPYASKTIHHFLGFARILTGTLGAALLALALKSRFISVGTGDGLEHFLLLCMVAGLSERLVPNFIERVEAAVAGSSSSAPRPRKS